MTYENKWEWKANYKYKWDNFLDYDMKNHDIHENKNVCPEFNGEKMHEHSVFPKMSFWQTLSLEKHQKEADNSHAVKVVPSISPKISKNWGNNAKNNFLAKFLGKPGGRKWDQRISRVASA